MFCFIFLLGHKILVTELMAILCILGGGSYIISCVVFYVLFTVHPCIIL